MAKITIPFREDMARSIQLGFKHCTSRNKKYGEVGDTFKVTDDGDTTTHRLIAVSQRHLAHVAYWLFDAEGFDSPVDFVDTWDQIHPKKTYGMDPKHIVWVHWFERCEAFIEEFSSSGNLKPGETQK